MATKSTAQRPTTASGCFRSQLRKTALCRHYSKGKCRYGSSCLFAHSDEELQNPPCLVKTSMCKAWMEGSCPFESHLCNFAHGREELRRTPAFQRKRGKGAAAEEVTSITEEDSISCDGSTAAASGTQSPSADDSVESESWEASTQCGFESEDEFECGSQSRWVSEGSAPNDAPSQMMQQQVPMQLPNQMVGCYMIPQAPMPQGFQGLPIQGGSMMPWPTKGNVTFVPVLVMQAPPAAPPTSA